MFHLAGEKVTSRHFPPMKDVARSLKIKWYRCPIDKLVLRELMQPSDFKGLCHAVGNLVLIILTGAAVFWAALEQIWWAFLALLFMHGTIVSFLNAPHHELCHRTVFKTKGLNDFFLVIFSFLSWNNFPVYQFSHNYHHRFTLHLDGDREEVAPMTPSLAPLYLLQLFTFNLLGGYQSKGFVPTVGGTVRLAMGRLDNPFNSWGDELFAGFEEHAATAIRWARVMVAGHVVLAILFLTVGQPILIPIVSGAAFIGNWWRYFVGATQHCGLKADATDFRKCSRTIRLDPFSEFLYWHMNWHLEHHMYAGVPCYNLKALHQVLREDMPEPRSVISAWREMRETWRRQQADPNYAYDTPVPERAGPDTDAEAVKLGASVGQLGPKELLENGAS